MLSPHHFCKRLPQPFFDPVLYAGEAVFLTLKLFGKNHQEVMGANVVFRFHPAQHPVELVVSTPGRGGKTVRPQLRRFPASLGTRHAGGQPRQVLDDRHAEE